MTMTMRTDRAIRAAMRIVCASCCSAAWAQPAWTDRFDGSGHDNDAGRAILVLGDTLFVAGNTFVPAGDNVLVSNGLLLAIDTSSGTRRFTRVFTAAQAHSGMSCSRLVHNPHDDSLVMACTLVTVGYGVFVFDRDGRALWSRLQLSTNATATDVVVGEGGQLSLIGNNDVIEVFTYNATGASLWNGIFSGPGGAATASRAVDDGAGGLLITGDVAISERATDLLVLRMASAGNTTWWHSYGGAGAFTTDRGEAIARRGNRLVAAGNINGNTANYSDGFVVSLDLDGHEQWRHTYSATLHGEDFLSDIALDDNGNAWAAGMASPTRLQREPLLLKLDALGQVQSELTPGNEFADIDVLRSVAVDADGAAHAAGEVRIDALNYGYLYVKVNALGTLEKREIYPGPRSGGSRAWSVAVDAARNAYVTGASFGDASGEDATTLRFDDRALFANSFE